MKFHIVAIAVATAVVSAVVAAQVSLFAIESHTQRLLIQDQRDSAERTAALLGTRLTCCGTR